jgi:outer membrane protein assembly factor BamB
MVLDGVTRRRIPLSLVVAFAGVALSLAVRRPGAAAEPDWPQWGRSPGHGASASGPAQPLGAILSDFVYDPFVPAATAEAGGNLLAHYPVPLLDGADVYMESKTGTYVSCFPPGSGQPAPCGADAWDRQIWNVQKLRWSSGALAPVWRFETDWKPEPNAGHLGGWEPVFHPALAAGFLWVPGSGGSVFRVSKDTGAATRISPFGSPIDPSIFVAGGIAADAAGNVYYNAIQLDPANPWNRDATGAWIVQVRPDGTFRRAAFSDLVPGASPGTAQCERQFPGGTSNLPLPPSPTAAPPTGPCGSQRPALNVVPAIGSDGTVFTVSRAHFSDRYAWLVAVDSSLAPRWAASLRDRLQDGCGVLLPPNGQPGGCREGTSAGVDPATNRPPAGRVIDLGTSSPVALDDGSVLFGAYTGFNYSRGHLLKFDAQGRFTASYDFGWDITPAVRVHDGTISVLLKDNHYEVGSYCGDPTFCPPESGRYDIVSLDQDLKPQWTFRNSNTESCARQPDGSVRCVSDHPDGFEWCINQPAVDGEGVVYANSEDGFLYSIGPDGSLRAKIFLNLAIGAAYTPLSIGSDGILYTQNNGHLFAVGNPLRPEPIRPTRRARPPGPIRGSSAFPGN